MSTEIDTVDGDDPGLARKVYRTVTPGYVSRPDAEMNVIGWGLFVGMIALLFPLLPFVVIIWGVSKTIEAIRGSDDGA